MTSKVSFGCVLALVAGVGQAEIVAFEAYLDGLQEVGPNASPGTGYATGTLDTVTFEVNLSGTFQDLIGTTTVSHIHGLAPVGVNAGVILGLTIDGGVTDGSFTGAGTLTAAQAQGLLDGLTYINVHTTTFAGGEIRGQIFVVPAPAGAALLGLGGLVLARRRR
ncbi:MAG: CHRD domain-containing protein [Phycisphaeraceae bacterium]|nr:MAG: CHRD domain-containing protein [Phycisphaeraceae bacterium]